MNEHTVEAVELFITESLLKGKSVIIPDFGHLEIKTLGNRKTVLFKYSESNDSFLRVVSVSSDKEKKFADALYSIISTPLKEGQVVNLPKTGVFRPVKRENGEIHVSFILSAYLRKLLTEGEVKKEAIKEVNKLADAKESKEKPQETPKEEITPNKVHVSTSTGKIAGKETVRPTDSYIREKTNLPRERKISKIGDQIVPQDDTYEKSRSRNLGGTILFIGVIITLAVVLVTTIHTIKNKKANDHVEIVLPVESIDLPSLAYQHYGNPVFWIYIYEANRDKLKSPVNIPKNFSLVIPDLKTEFDVDVVDSLEIQRATIRADIVLKEIIKK